MKDWPAYRDLFWGIVWLSFGTLSGRLMHIAHRYKITGKRPTVASLIWEIPIVIGMALVALGVRKWAGLSPEQAICIATIMGYAGPRVVEAALIWAEDRYLKGGK